MLFKAGCLLEVLSLAVFSTHVHIMVQKIYFGSLFVAKFYFAFSRKAYFVVTYGSFYGSQFSPSYGSNHIFFLNLFSMPYEFLFSSLTEINVYIFTFLIAYLCLTLSAAYNTCMCTTN